MSEWRYFGTREVRSARQWAAQGGIAVHENIWKARGRRTCHLLAETEAQLLRAARTVGCADTWIQRTRTLHFDLVDVYLERALMLCGGDPAHRQEICHPTDDTPDGPAPNVCEPVQRIWRIVLLGT